MAEKKGAEKPKESKKGMGVYTVKQATSTKGKFSKSGAVVVRAKACITHAAADQMNAHFEKGFNGRFCELNEKADKEYQDSNKSKAKK